MSMGESGEQSADNWRLAASGLTWREVYFIGAMVMCRAFEYEICVYENQVQVREPLTGPDILFREHSLQY